MLGVVVESEAGWPLYPYDLGRGDSVITVGDSEVILIDMNATFHFYRDRYNKIYLRIRQHSTFWT